MTKFKVTLLVTEETEDLCRSVVDYMINHAGNDQEEQPIELVSVEEVIE